VRDLTRYRMKTVQARTSEIQRLAGREPIAAREKVSPGYARTIGSLWTALIAGSLPPVLAHNRLIRLC
jgi:hypothetical protein